MRYGNDDLQVTIQRQRLMQGNHNGTPSGGASDQYFQSFTVSYGNDFENTEKGNNPVINYISKSRVVDAFGNPATFGQDQTSDWTTSAGTYKPYGINSNITGGSGY